MTDRGETTGPQNGHGSNWDSGKRKLQEALDSAVRHPAAKQQLPEPDCQAPEFSDEALALQFSACHHERLRYVAAWNKWLIWDGQVWRSDDTLHAFDLARAICREAAVACGTRRLGPAIASAKAVAAVERLAKADRRHAATVDQWDADPWLLNTPDGIIDLRTGNRRTHCARDYMTKKTAVAPGGSCPRWLQFLEQITDGDGELQAYLQRVAGYLLTGLTREQVLFFAYGTGGNGKGVFLNTLIGILGGYAVVADADTFTATGQTRHLTELARLQGARLVVAQETEQGRQWAESRIKSITGGDPITANFMRQDLFTFTPQFKLFMAGNHKPGLRSTDEAIRRRLHLILFGATISAAMRDHGLAEKLKNEWPGILQWMIGGCLAWQAEGLSPPFAVLEATSSYLETEDTLGQWLTEYCEHQQQPLRWQPISQLYESWRAWADKAGELTGSQKQFSQALEARGFAYKRKANGRGFEGLKASSTG